MSAGESVTSIEELESGWEVDRSTGMVADRMSPERVDGLVAELSDTEDEGDLEEFDEEDFDDDFDDDFEEELEDEYEIEGDDSVLGPEFTTTSPGVPVIDNDELDGGFEEDDAEDAEEEK